MEIFADVLFVINFSMDFLALFLTGKILSMPVRGKRLAAASALGHEKYLASVSETMHRAVGKAAAAAGDGEFGVFSADRNGFCDYCLAAAKKTAPKLLSVSGAVI